MRTLIDRLLVDETGFIVSAELILIATIAVLSMVVGLNQISNAINQELEDVASAFGSVQQSYFYRGLRARHKAGIWGSYFEDEYDFCDSPYDIVGTPPVSEEGGPFRGRGTVGGRRE